MTAPDSIPIHWSRDFIVIEGAEHIVAVRAVIEATSARWIIVSRLGGRYLYVLSVAEVLAAVTNPLHQRIPDLRLETALRLGDDLNSNETEELVAPPPEQRWKWKPPVLSVNRYVELGAQRTPIAVGTPLSPTLVSPEQQYQQETMKWRQQQQQKQKKDWEEHTWVESRRSLETTAVWATDEPSLPTLEDEGTTPVRYPSIEVDRALVPGVKATFTFDLTRSAQQHTTGGPVAVRDLSDAWSELPLTVVLSCRAIDFDNDGRGEVTIKRNAASVAAEISGTVRDGAPGEPLDLVANVFHGNRFCGSALRTFALGAAGETAATALSRERGTIAAEVAARDADVTVRITTLDSAKGIVEWLVQTDRFDGLPPNLREKVELGAHTGTDAAGLFATFATLTRGDHRRQIEGFGDRIWNKAPQMFRDVYWVLWDHYKRPFSIQFISDEPHIPWELMRPARGDDIHEPLALMHPVGRWIERWDGYMRNDLPAGSIFTIAPKYETHSRRLPRAQAEAEALIEKFEAKSVGGKKQDVLALLEHQQPPTVAILHFAGHGHFSRSDTTDSNIELEDEPLLAGEIERPEVRLGRLRRTLVFFNACEVGATGRLFGTLGGWADAFLGRQFGGFIAPLWAVDDEDASKVATELIEGIYKERRSIGEVMRDIRKKHGDESPTFFSYLYYGDVTAQFVKE